MMSKQAKREYDKKYREDNTEKIKKYYKDNKEKIAEQGKKYREDNKEKCLAKNMEYRYKRGGRSMNENKECAAYLGIHVAERVLSKIFKGVEVMPRNNPGYDFICNKGKKIDVKSSTLCINSNRFRFRIANNRIAELFLCIAFDNRDNLNPLHIWLLPGHIINHLTTASISINKIDKWDEYRLEIDKVIECCETMKSTDTHAHPPHAMNGCVG